jgi:hydroxyacylglutathione hydrolase
MKIHVFVFNPFQENTYLVADESGKCLIIDPGMADEAEAHILFDFIEKHNYSPELIVNTHCHLDHILGNQSCVNRFSIPILASEGELAMLDRAPSASLMWGVPYRISPNPDRFIKNGERISIGQLEFVIADVPGHSPGHVALIERNQKAIFSGDVLFRGSIGRSDLPGCDGQLLLQSIRGTLYQFPDDFVVYSGHGPETTIGEEKKHNPFVRG